MYRIANIIKSPNRDLSEIQDGVFKLILDSWLNFKINKDKNKICNLMGMMNGTFFLVVVAPFLRDKSP